MAAGSQKKGGGGKKLGSNKKWCESYLNRGQREKNKTLKILRHLKRQPNDRQAVKDAKRLGIHENRVEEARRAGQ